MEKLVEGGSLDFNLCIICQNQSADDLVENSTSHDKLFRSIDGLHSAEERVEIVRWHRKCYQNTTLLKLDLSPVTHSCMLPILPIPNTTHSCMLKRAKERIEREVAGQMSQEEKQVRLYR